MATAMRTADDLHDFYEEINDEFLKFDRVTDKRHRRPDMHAFLLLDALVPGDRDMVCSAEHDEIWLEVDVEVLLQLATHGQLVELHRCGVRCDENGLCMFV